MPARSTRFALRHLVLASVLVGSAGLAAAQMHPVEYDPTLVPTTAPATTATPSSRTRPETGTKPGPETRSVFGEIGTTKAADSEVSQGSAGSLRQITTASVGADFDPDMSTDGTFMVFASTQHRTTADIYFKRSDASVITQLTNHPAEDVMPSISPDGRRIAFASDRGGQWDIFVMPAAGGKAVQITTDPAHELHPSWSPDGSSLVFCRLGEQSGQWELWVVDVSNPTVTHAIGHGLFPEWCPVPGTGLDGADQIVFQRPRERGDRQFAIWTIDYANGQVGSPTELMASADEAFVNPSWGPDGLQVVFASIREPAGQTAQADLWMMQTTGNGLVNLTQGSARDLMPVWGNDHNIYFVSARAGRENIWALDARPALMAASGESANPNTFATAPTD